MVGERTKVQKVELGNKTKWPSNILGSGAIKICIEWIFSKIEEMAFLDSISCSKKFIRRENLHKTKFSKSLKEIFNRSKL